MKPRMWTPEEDQVIRAGVVAGKTYEEISTDLENRTRAAVKGRIRWINISPEVRKESNRKKRARRIVPAHYQKWGSVKNTHVPPDVIEDAIRRARAPRSLTAILMGDPEPNRRKT